MSNIVVVYHSGYGHTQRMAQSVAQGAGAQLLAIDADGNLPEGGWEQLAAADAICQLGILKRMAGMATLLLRELGATAAARCCRAVPSRRKLARVAPSSNHVAHPSLVR